jgi:hypothetical protein
MASPRTVFTPRVLASVLAGIGLIVLALAAVSFIGSVGFAYDFQAYDLAARRIAAGEALYPEGTVEAYNQGRFEGLYLYPPPLAIALLPLTILGPHEAAIAFLVLRIGMLIVGCALLPVRREVRLAVLGVACVSFPVLYDLNLGNVSVVIFFLSACIWRWQDSPVGAAVLAGAMAIRPTFLIVLIGWLVRGAFRPVLWTIAAGVVILVLMLPIVGVPTWLDYVTILRGLGPTSTGEHNISLSSLAGALGLSPEVATIALFAGYVLALGSVAFAARRRDADVAVVVSIGATLVLTPFIHSHYLAILLIPAALLADRGWWWALALPLLGWLPVDYLPLVAVAGMTLPLLSSGPATRSVSIAQEPSAVSTGP